MRLRLCASVVISRSSRRGLLLRVCLRDHQPSVVTRFNRLGLADLYQGLPTCDQPWYKSGVRQTMKRAHVGGLAEGQGGWRLPVRLWADQTCLWNAACLISLTFWYITYLGQQPVAGVSVRRAADSVRVFLMLGVHAGFVQGAAASEARSRLLCIQSQRESSRYSQGSPLVLSVGELWPSRPERWTRSGPAGIVEFGFAWTFSWSGWGEI